MCGFSIVFSSRRSSPRKTDGRVYNAIKDFDVRVCRVCTGRTRPLARTKLYLKKKKRRFADRVGTAATCRHALRQPYYLGAIVVVLASIGGRAGETGGENATLCGPHARRTTRLAGRVSRRSRAGAILIASGGYRFRRGSVQLISIARRVRKNKKTFVPAAFAMWSYGAHALYADVHISVFRDFSFHFSAHRLANYHSIVIY